MSFMRGGLRGDFVDDGGIFRHEEGILLAVVDFSDGANFNERICAGPATPE